MNNKDKSINIIPVRCISGSIPEPDQLIGRDREIRQIIAEIPNVNIILLSPRRFGKSGILLSILKNGIPGFLPLYVMVEEINNPEDFLSELMQALSQHKSIFIKCFSQIHKIPAKLFNWFKKQGSFKYQDFEWSPKEDEKISWMELGDILFQNLEKCPQKIVFMIDEFPKMIERFHENGFDIDVFLSWFRSCRITDKDALRKHRFIITGSIGINYLLKKTKTTTALNDLIRIYVGEISEEKAILLLKGLYLNYYKKEPEGEFVNNFFEILDCRVPFFIHLFFDQLQQHESAGTGSFSKAILNEVFWKSLLGTRCKTHFDHYYDRLGRYEIHRKKAALIVLRKLAKQIKIKRTDLFKYLKSKSKDIGKKIDDSFFNDLMADLEVEWYIIMENPEQNLENQSYCFKIPLLARWWNRFYPSLEED